MRFLLLLLGVLSVPAYGQSAPDPALAQSLRQYSSIRQFMATRGDRLWPGLGAAPFDFLMIGPNDERLYCRKSLPDGFVGGQDDPATGCKSATRPRSGLPAGLLAAMPIFGAPSTIVMGTAQATDRTDADWTRTIIHEHFHQWQDGLPSVYARIAGLGLSGGDETGMWMLNYPFPYAEPKTVAAANTASLALGAALDARGTPKLRVAFRKYLSARNAFARSVGAANWRYAEFELWKEGVARWTEIELGKTFPDPAIKASANQLEHQVRAWLDKPDIANAGREFVYPYGAAEAMLLEACDPRWRARYPKTLALGPLLDMSRGRCG